MGEIIGFVCSKCNYEKSYFLGVGFNDLKEKNLYDEIWQAFCVLIPIKTVGVMGDERTYENTIAIRAVNSVDGMTANWSRIPFDILDLISSEIINNVKGINKVVFDISNKPPSTIEWE